MVIRSAAYCYFTVGCFPRLPRALSHLNTGSVSSDSLPTPEDAAPRPITLCCMWSRRMEEREQRYKMVPHRSTRQQKAQTVASSLPLDLVLPHRTQRKNVLARTGDFEATSYGRCTDSDCSPIVVFHESSPFPSHTQTHTRQKGPLKRLYPEHLFSPE